ncbi:MAG TPA: hypothetical protein VG936_01890 [Lacunisphaera sp.]|nr:hypothetical protein [Lacunisphaera sp.]
MNPDSDLRKLLLWPAIACGLVSAFFVFYAARLLVVTKGLTAVRAGGNGAYMGAAVFPCLALGFGWACVRLIRKSRSTTRKQ